MIVALVGVLGSGAVMAADAKFDGNMLLSQCQQYINAADSQKYNQIDAAVCGGFIQGVTSTVFFFSEDLKKNDRFCLPDNATNGQIARIVVKYLKDNPKLLNEGRAGLVWLALKDAYPCK